MMQRKFESEIEEITEAILSMAGLAERSLEEAARSLTSCDAALAQVVIDRDDEIDQLEVEIDRLATEFIVRHQPAATDLRFAIVAIKLGPELERVADNAVNIAERVQSLCRKSQSMPKVDLKRILALARAMVEDAIAAYVDRDAQAAREIIGRDDEVDELYLQILRALLTYMIEDPSTVTRALNLVFIARYAERVADQATNIAEEVVYLVEGKPVRHQHPDGGSVGD
jgi:phosphate transport system protein